MPPRSLLGEILRWMLAPLVLLCPVSFAVTYLVAQAIASTPFDHALGQHAYALAHQIAASPGGAPVQLSAAQRDWLLHDPEDTRLFQVRGPDARLLDGSAALPAPGDLPRPGIIRFRDQTVDGRAWRIAYTQAALHRPDAGGAPSGLALVQIAETRHKRAALAGDILKGVLLPQLVILPMVVVLVWLGLSRGLAPLYALQARIHERRPDDRSPLDTSQAPLEIAPLLATFNTLLARLDDSALVQKRFIAQAAHQMKTPLAGLRMQAELALRQPVNADVRHSLEQMAAGSRQAARLVTQLLALARAEDGGAARDMHAVDLDRLARDVIRDWAPWALEKGMDLGYEGPDDVGDATRATGAAARPAADAGSRSDSPPGSLPASSPDSGCTVHAQRVMLREMLANLLDNAIRYTPAGGRITVRLRAVATAPRLPSETPTYVAIEVEDTGPGIPPGERVKVRERFYRILGREGDGSGLGLAIVDEIVAMHGGTLTIDAPPPLPERPSPGTLIRLALPVSPDRAIAPARPSGVSKR